MWKLLILTLSSAYDCKFSLPTGEKYDFTKFIRNIPDYEADSMDFVYRLNICGDTAILCNGEFGIASQWNYNGGCVSVLARQYPTTPTLSKKDDSLILTYSNGDFCLTGVRKVNYIFHCSTGRTKIGLAEESEPCVYNFDVYSKYACFDATVGTAVQGSYFWVLYVALGLVLVYFVIGFVYNKLQDKTLNTVEAFPHGEKILNFVSSFLDR